MWKEKLAFYLSFSYLLQFSRKLIAWARCSCKHWETAMVEVGALLRQKNIINSWSLGCQYFFILFHTNHLPHRFFWYINYCFISKQVAEVDSWLLESVLPLNKVMTDLTVTSTLHSCLHTVNFHPFTYWCISTTTLKAFIVSSSTDLWETEFQRLTIYEK